MLHLWKETVETLDFEATVQAVQQAVDGERRIMMPDYGVSGQEQRTISLAAWASQA